MRAEHRSLALPLTYIALRGVTTRELTMIQDLELITSFMEKSLKKENVGTRSNHLKAHTICNNNQLLAKDEGIVAAIHLSQDPLCFMVKLRSLYWELINKMLMDKNFIPLESKSGIDFYRYQHCEIPQAYEINCTNPSQLWRKWWVKSRNTNKNIFALNFLIRTRNSWYPIQDIFVEGETICVKTLGSIIPLTEADIVIWLQKTMNPSQPLKTSGISRLPNTLSRSKILKTSHQGRSNRMTLNRHKSNSNPSSSNAHANGPVLNALR